MRIPRRSSLLLALLVTAVTAAPAGATPPTPRYADPAGSGSVCDAASPCSLPTAISGALNNGEIVVNPGDYPLTGTIQTFLALNIHGVPGSPRPRLLFSGNNQEGVRLLGGGTFRYLEVDQSEQVSGLHLGYGAVGESLLLKGTAAGVPTVTVQKGSLVRDSIVIATGTNGTAGSTEVSGGTTVADYRNVTAIATGSGGVGIRAIAIANGSSTDVNLLNVIVRGGPNGASLKAKTDSSGAQAKITPVYTNYSGLLTDGTFASIPSIGAGNQTVDPLFVDAAGGDYHEAPGSPTIDAGIDEVLNGDFDFELDGRIFGVTDIGADESPYSPPPPPPPPPPPAPPAGGGGSDSGGGSGGGSDTPTQTTVEETGGSTPVTTTTTDQTVIDRPVQETPFAGVSLVSKRLRLVGRYVRVRLSCPAAAKGGCAGRLKLLARRELARARFVIAPGARLTVRLHVGRTARARLAHVGRLRAKVDTAAHDNAGQTAASRTSVTLRRAS